MENFLNGFQFKPKVENEEAIRPWKKVVVGGMGGSALSAGLYQMLEPATPLRTHRNYGLPDLLSDESKETLFVASSYSGETEETISFFEKACGEDLNVAVLADGGALLDMAQASGIPHVDLPGGLTQRYALGHSLLGLCTLVGNNELGDQIRNTGFDLVKTNASALSISKSLAGKEVLIISSSGESILSYIWKIFLNETSKVPAFWNVIPEFNHNEIEMFEAEGKDFAVVLLPAFKKNPRIARRFEITREILERKGVGVLGIDTEAEGVTVVKEILAMAVLVSEGLASFKGIDPESTPLIDEFKSNLRS